MVSISKVLKVNVGLCVNVVEAYHTINLYYAATSIQFMPEVTKCTIITYTVAFCIHSPITGQPT